jgi:hypothetical protein
MATPGPLHRTELLVDPILGLTNSVRWRIRITQSHALIATSAAGPIGVTSIPARLGEKGIDGSGKAQEGGVASWAFTTRPRRCRNRGWSSTQPQRQRGRRRLPA